MRGNDNGEIINIHGIVACDPQGVMGYRGALSWHYPQDLAHFRETIQGHIIIMGYRTYTSMPASTLALAKESWVWVDARALSSRHCEEQRDAAIQTFMQLPELLRLFKARNDDLHYYIIGGAATFNLLFDHIETMIVTHIRQNYPGDTFFPLDRIASWQAQEIKATEAFRIVHYTRP